jgi:hemerythrin-like domain-containing protein
MNALNSLITEHQIISRVADALEAYAQRILGDGPVDPADLGHFADLFVDFAEGIHHDKEENILLPALSRHGSSWNSGVLKAVRRDHRQEAYLIDVLRQAGERAGSWSNEDRRHIVATALALVEFQRRHHALESAELFPLALARLNERDLLELKEALAKFDREHEPRRTASLRVAQWLIGRHAPVTSVLRSERAHGAEAHATADDEEECCLGIDDH